MCTLAAGNILQWGELERLFVYAHSTPLVSLGSGTLTGRNGRGIVVYFAVTFDQHPASFGVWENGRLKPGQASVQAGGSTAAAYYGENSCCSYVYLYVCMCTVWSVL